MSKLADLVFSPDDEADSGKGWYVDVWEGKSSSLMETRQEAEQWAKERGLEIVSVFDNEI